MSPRGQRALPWCGPVTDRVDGAVATSQSTNQMVKEEPSVALISTRHAVSPVHSDGLRGGDVKIELIYAWKTDGSR